MALSEQDQRRIIQQESAWIDDGSFGQRRGKTVAEQFKKACPSYIETQHNSRVITSTLAFNALSAAKQSGTIDEMVADLIDGGHWTVPNLVACFNALTQEGLLDVESGQPRHLTERERLRVARMAQAGRADEAIDEYLRCALDGEEATLEMVNDPVYRQVCDDAVLTVFEEITLDYIPTPERQRYLLRHCGSRPLTLALLQQAWRACQANEQRRERGELHSANTSDHMKRSRQPRRKLTRLDDDQVDELFHSSLRAYAENIRHTGIIA